MNLLIMGLPGTGKGTQTAKIIEKLGVAHVPTGDMFRAAVANKTETGVLIKSSIDKDELVSDEVTDDTVKEHLAQDDIVEKGFLLDDYPRTIRQTHALDGTLNSLDLKLDGVINIEVSPESLIKRLSGHIINHRTDGTFHKVLNPPAGDYNEGGFYQRKDGESETVKRCLDINTAQGAPIIEHHRRAGIAFGAQGNQDIDDAFADIIKAISSLK